MTKICSRRSARALALGASLAVLAGCASLQSARLEPPQGTRALGLEFGVDRAAAQRELRAAGIETREVPRDPDALVADRCPGAPVRAPCRLLFGPQGLYAAQIELPATEAKALADAVERGLGRPDRSRETAADGATVLVAGWDRPGWTVAVTRGGSGTAEAGRAICRVEYDRAAPPVVAGVPLGRLRDDVERALDIQGAMLIQRDAGASTYLACPQGVGEALSCIVLYRGGRAAAVSEVHRTPADDPGALSAWRVLAKKFEKEIGRAPETVCPADGPDRVAGDCTATWGSDRLVVVVGAHRNAGSRHRGTISVYTAFTYPPLGGKGDEEEAEVQAEAR